LTFYSNLTISYHHYFRLSLAIAFTLLDSFHLL
jgi:hypothetical protein